MKSTSPWCIYVMVKINQSLRTALKQKAEEEWANNLRGLKKTPNYSLKKSFTYPFVSENRRQHSASLQ